MTYDRMRDQFPLDSHVFDFRDTRGANGALYNRALLKLLRSQFRAASVCGWIETERCDRRRLWSFSFLARSKADAYPRELKSNLFGGRPSALRRAILGWTAYLRCRARVREALLFPRCGILRYVVLALHGRVSDCIIYDVAGNRRRIFAYCCTRA